MAPKKEKKNSRTCSMRFLSEDCNAQSGSAGRLVTLSTLRFPVLCSKSEDAVRPKGDPAFLSEVLRHLVSH